MTADPFWPGRHRAGETFDAAALVRAMTAVEAAWSAEMRARGLAPAADIESFAPTPAEIDEIARESELGGNPVIPFVHRLRAHVHRESPAAADHIHRGLTSQDVLDSALMLLAHNATGTVLAEMDRQLRTLTDLTRTHRDTLMTARTLGQPAAPTTFGLRALGWRDDVASAATRIRAWRACAPAQFGGAVGNLAVLTDRLGGPDSALDVTDSVALRLGLRPAQPWHTARGPVTGLGDALVTACDAWGHIGNDIVGMTRSELGELSEPAAPGRGGSSAMPHKRNPVLSILLRRTGSTAPLLGAQLHLAAAGSTEERADGAWHTEWATLRELTIQTLATASIATELLTGLRVDRARMRSNLDAALGYRLGGRDPESGLGATRTMIDRALRDEEGE
ncbi:lyase family protein [Nocardia sp. NPDC051570]|uniref:lyase family protein n=1 Tax=Nocardia sp. NPDC051570 TaxID=3364324 RepID=UPI0037AB6873